MVKKNVKKNNKMKEILQAVYYVVCVIVIVGAVLYGYHKLDEQSKADRAEKVQAYKECIQEQSDKQGWIIRSYCSLDYASLDAEAGLIYEQKGYDLYLKK